MNTVSADDFESGSRAAAAGGVTTILDFTVQEKGQSLREALEVRLAKARDNCHVDYGVHVNVTAEPERWLEQIPELIANGFTSFKVFSTYRQAGMMVSWQQFRRILEQVNRHGGLLMLHAEDNELVETMTAKNISAGNLAPIFHARSRTAETEARAITQAARIAGELDAALYIVHLSSRAGLEAGLQARAQGVKLHLETCPQYLLLNEALYLRDNGHLFITTPPLRTKDDNDALWEALRDGHIDAVGTDHCPFTMAQKNSGKRQFHLTPNGMPGVQTLFPLLYSKGVMAGKLTLNRLVQVLAHNTARLFGLSTRKGAIQLGADADLVLWNPNHETFITRDNLRGNAGWSPFEGERIAGKLENVLLRGENVIAEGEFCSDLKHGKLVRSQ